tara:strand:- start:156 stop:371 length:216 start_codon:yes stop_codon:yes gene_type:complete
MSETTFLVTVHHDRGMNPKVLAEFLALPDGPFMESFCPPEGRLNRYDGYDGPYVHKVQVSTVTVEAVEVPY